MISLLSAKVKGTLITFLRDWFSCRFSYVLCAMLSKKLSKTVLFYDFPDIRSLKNLGKTIRKMRVRVKGPFHGTLNPLTDPSTLATFTLTIES
jgi:hypothetical protein